MSPTPSVLRPARRAVSVLSLLLAGATAPACAAGADADPQAASKQEIVAEVGGKPITLKELEEALAPQLAEVDRQRRQILEDGLVRVVENRLVDAEAAARGVTVQELFQSVVDQPAGEVSDADAAAFYSANQSRFNRPLEQMQAQIKTYLGNQKRAQLRNDFVASLRAKHATRILLEPLRADVADAASPAKGPADAPVTIVEFSDFQCPYCARVLPTIDQALATYGDKIRVVFRQFPLNIHPQAQKAAEASLCANDQGKFWELHDAMFSDQRALSVEQLKSKAATLGIGATDFEACLDGGKYAAQVAEDLRDGSAAGVSGTPAMFVNGRFLSGAVPFEQLARLIDDELARKGIEPKSAG